MADFKIVQTGRDFVVEKHPYAEGLCFITERGGERMAYQAPTVKVQKEGEEFYDEDDEGYGPGIMEPLRADASRRIAKRLESGEHLTATDIPAEDVLEEIGLTKAEANAYISGRAGKAYTIYDPDEYAETFSAQWDAGGNEPSGEEEFRQRWGCNPSEFSDHLKAGTLTRHSEFEQTGAVVKYGEPVWFVAEIYE